MKRNVLIVDYGGVLGDHHQEPAESLLGEALGVNRATARRLVSEKSPQGRAFREDRLTEKEFWDRVAKLAGLGRQRPPDKELSQLWAETYEVNSDIVRVLQEVRAKYPVGVLTNIDRARSRYLVEHVGIYDYIDLYLPSYRFGAIKPDSKLWLAVRKEVEEECGGATVFYVDDRETHVEGCGAIGWHGILYENTTQLVEELKTKGLIR